MKHKIVGIDIPFLFIWENIPEFSSSTNQSKSDIAQICILEHGLRHGGHVGFLLGTWENMSRLSQGSSAQTFTYIWANANVMFRELMHYCVVTSGTTGIYSLLFQSSFTVNNFYLNFWSGNICYQVCLGSGPRGILLLKKIYAIRLSYLSQFESPPNGLSLINFDTQLGACLVNSLPGTNRTIVVNGFGSMELEKCLAMPTLRILKRHDFRTILDFLLIKLRLLIRNGCQQLQYFIRYGIFFI